MYEVGTTIYVNRMGWVNTEPNLEEMTVSKCNKTSVYVTTESGLEYRLSVRTLAGKCALASFQGYLEADTYWNKIKAAKERQQVIEDIKRNLYLESDEELKRIQASIKRKKGK